MWAHLSRRRSPSYDMQMPSRRRASVLPSVDLGGVAEETSLPLPWVEYPGHYRAVLRFADRESGPFSFCSCTRSALKNAARLGAMPQGRQSEGTLLSTQYVSGEAAREAYGKSIDDIERFSFRDAICHRCNKVPPTARRWCHEMYGTPLTQAIGWYIHLAALDGGVDPNRPELFIADMVPNGVRPDLEEYVVLVRSTPIAHADEPRTAELRDSLKRLRAARSRVLRFFRSEARASFGFSRVGEGWASEAHLFSLVHQLLPPTRLVRHARPAWLEGLELDIYAPELGLGIEYQGEQHGSAVAHWGGQTSLLKQRDRDLRKRALCAAHGCTLLEVWHHEPLTLIAIAAKLRDAKLPLRSD